MSKVKPIPEGYRTITPYISLKDAAKAIEFYKEAFNATEIECCHTPDGKVMHAVIKIGDSLLMLSDEMPGSDCCISSPTSLKGTCAMLALYVEDADDLFDRAVKAGAKVHMPLDDMFWGDRYGQLLDPFGHYWSVSTHKEDLTKEEINKRAEAFFAQHASANQCC